MKEELISLCADLERNIGQRLVSYDDRLTRLDKEMGKRIERLLLKYPDDRDVIDLAHLGVGLRQTGMLIRSQLATIRIDSDELFSELAEEVKERMPGIRERLENCDTYEEAMIELKREVDNGSYTKLFREILRSLLP